MPRYGAWVASFVQQLPALTGVVVGVLGSLVVATVGDRARFRRDQHSRWQDRRLAAYSDYARAMKANVNVMFRLAAHFGNDPNPHPLKPEEAEALLARSVEARDMAWEMVLLVGSAEVAAAARGWFLTIAALERSAHRTERDPASWEDLVTRQFDARLEFYNAVRRDLALGTGGIDGPIPARIGGWRRAGEAGAGSEG
jgi:hypothetical protein